MCPKSYYDETDWEIICVIGNDLYDLYDLSIYYGQTRMGDYVITEVGYENV